MFLIFVLGWPFEWPAIVLVFLPIFLPVVEKLDFGMSKLDMLIWFGALVAVNLQTAFLSPPVAMSAYYLKNVVPQWSLSTIYRGMADYMVIQIVVPAGPAVLAADRALAAAGAQITPTWMAPAAAESAATSVAHGCRRCLSSGRLD